MAFVQQPKTLHLRLARVRFTRASKPYEAAYIKGVKRAMERMEKNLLRLIAHIENVTPDAMLYALKPAFDESQELVPVRTGRLKRSGFLMKDTSTGYPRVLMGYGLHGQPHYAALVHEVLDWYHRPPTQARFLTEAINRHQQDFILRVQEFLRLERHVSVN